MNESVLASIMQRPVPPNVGNDTASDPKRYYSTSTTKPGFGIWERTQRVLDGFTDITLKQSYPSYCRIGEHYPCVKHRGDHSYINGEYWEDCTAQHERMLRKKGII